MNNSLPFSPGDSIFAYLRDSGHEDQDLSIDQQENALRRWASENDLVLSHIYKDAARKGSSTIGRDDLQNMMHAFRHGCIERGVVVWKYNRFARSVDNAQYYRAEIRSRGYIFHSMNDSVPEGPMGRLFEAAIDFKDEQYLIDLSIDVKRGLRDLVEKYGCRPGKVATCFKKEAVVIGVRRDGSPHVAHKWIPDPVMFPRGRRAFEMRAARASLGAIQKETRILPSINSYRTFFANPIYRGTLKHGDLVIENYYEPMVSIELWDRVQAVQKNYVRYKHASSNTDHPRRISSRFLLSGLAHCSLCGSPLFGHASKKKSGNTYDSYFCTRAYRRRDCSKRRIPRELFENAVIQTLRDEVLKPENLIAAYQKLRDSQAALLTEHMIKRRSKTHELASVRKQITNVSSSLKMMGASKSLTDLLKDLETQEAELQSQIAYIDAAAEQPVLEITPDLLVYYAANFHKIFPNADLETKRMILRLALDHVDVTRENGLIRGIIYYYYPPELSVPKVLGPEEIETEVSLYQSPSGPPRYRHLAQMAFEVRFMEYHKKKRQ